MMLRLLESASLEGSRGQISPRLSIFLQYTHGIPYAFCVCYMVSGLHSTHFFVIQLLLRLICFEGKEKTSSQARFFSVHTMSEHLEAAPDLLRAWCGHVGL